MYCKYCGAELMEGQTFCADCGNQVGKLFEEEKPKKAGLDVGMFVWSILGMCFCGVFSIPALVMTVLASIGTEEESKVRLAIARKFNIASMIFGAVMNVLVCLYILFYVVFVMMMVGMA
jgi:hypothetical protein